MFKYLVAGDEKVLGEGPIVKESACAIGLGGGCEGSAPGGAGATVAFVNVDGLININFIELLLECAALIIGGQIPPVGH